MSLSIAVDIVITGSVHVAPEGTRSVDRNGNFFEKGVRESAFFGDASAGLGSVSPGLGVGSGAIAFRLPFSRV